MKKLILYTILVANFIALFLIWLEFSGSLLQTPSIGNSMIGIGRLVGLFAANLILLQLILIGRVKWVEQLFGLDKLSNIHRLNGYLILGLIVLHPILITQGYSLLNETTYLGQYQDFIKNWDDLFKAFLGFWVLIITIVLSITIVRRKLKYETWYYVHVFNYIAIALIFSHQLQYATGAQSEAFKYYWYALYIFAFGNLLWFRFLRPLLNFYRHQFTVTKVENLGSATSIYISGRNLGKFKVIAGQFMIFRFLQKGFWKQAHPFSLSIVTSENQLRLTAKNLGDYTSQLPNLAPGTKVLIDGPHGIFTPSRSTHDKVLFIAGGIGITPIRSLMEAMADSGKKLHLFYSNKSESDILLKDELDNIAKDNTNIKLDYLLSNEEKPGFVYGMLNKDLIKTLVPDVAEYDIYLCGPPPMMKALRVALEQLGVPKKQIYFEKFSL